MQPHLVDSILQQRSSVFPRYPSQSIHFTSFRWSNFLPLPHHHSLLHIYIQTFTMYVPFATTIFTVIAGLAAISPVSAGAVLARAPQNGNRPVPSGACCVANTSLKQDACTAANGAAGRCVPGGNNCKNFQSTPHFIHPDDSRARPRFRKK